MPKEKMNVLFIITDQQRADMLHCYCNDVIKTPNIDKYITTYPALTLVAAGESVGLSWGEMGNSEVGHTNIGTGIIFYQNF